MRLGAIPYLLRATVRGRRMRSAAVVAGLGVGMLALGLSTVVGLGATRSLQRHLDSLFPEQRVVLRPATVEALMLQADTTSITPDTVAAVRALPGVVRVSPEAAARFPLSAQGQLLGQAYSTDLSVTGVEAWLLGDEQPDYFEYDPAKDKYLPTVLSHYFLDLYNSALAEANDLPKFSSAAIIGRHMKLFLGISTIHPDGVKGVDREVRVVEARVAGLTRNPDLLGLLVPLEVVESFNEWYGLEDKIYRALHVELESAEAIENIKPQLAAMGLAMRDRMAPWRKALILVRLVGIAFVGLGVLVFALALAYLASAITWMLSERRRELALFRALGASPRQAMTVLTVEIGLVSLLGIVIGLGIAVMALAFTNGAYMQWRADRAFLPDTLFAVPWWWIGLLGLSCWFVAMCLALTRVIAGTRIPISGALARDA